MDEYNTMSTVLFMLGDQLSEMDKSTEPIEAEKLQHMETMLNGLLKITFLISIADPIKTEKAYNDCRYVYNIDKTDYNPNKLGNLIIRIGMMSASLFSLKKKYKL